MYVVHEELYVYVFVIYKHFHSPDYFTLTPVTWAAGLSYDRQVSHRATDVASRVLTNVFPNRW